VLKPYRLRIVTVDTGDTVKTLSQSMPLTDFREAQFKSMNGYDANERVQVGDLVKVVE
jgi:predicted Zn-dependent protease